MKFPLPKGLIMQVDVAVTPREELLHKLREGLSQMEGVLHSDAPGEEKIDAVFKAAFLRRAISDAEKEDSRAVKP